MERRLLNKIAFVTGAARGIGFAITKLFLAQGAIVVASDKDLSVLEDSCKEFDLNLRNRIITMEVNTTNEMQVQEAIDRTVQKFGRIDILINNAGVNVFEDPLSLTEDVWERCFSINLKGAWNCSQAALKYMVKQEYGNIVNIASVHGHSIIKGCFPYPVAKHGLIGLTKALGIEYAGINIRVNSISPGLILTHAIEKSFQEAEDPQAEIQKQLDILPCKRIGDPIEVAFTALFLASDEARFINATDIKIDGGRSAVYHD